MANEETLAAETRARVRAAAELAAECEAYQCRFCQAIKPLSEGIVVTWGGSVLFAMCPQCFPGAPIVIKETTNSKGQRAVYVGPLRDSTRAQEVASNIVVAGADLIGRDGLFTPRGAIAAQQRLFDPLSLTEE
jgi:hypothetical protein